MTIASLLEGRCGLSYKCVEDGYKSTATPTGDLHTYTGEYNLKC